MQNNGIRTRRVNLKLIMTIQKPLFHCLRCRANVDSYHYFSSKMTKTGFKDRANAKSPIISDIRLLESSLGLKPFKTVWMRSLLELCERAEFLRTQSPIIEKRKFTRKEFEIHKIVGHRIQNGEAQLFVQWEGYDSSHNTWEPWFNVEHTDAVKEYISKRGLEITPSSILMYIGEGESVIVEED